VRRRGWSGRSSAFALVAALGASALLFPVLLHRPAWVEAETVLGVWWAIWVGVLGYVAHSGRPIEDDYAPNVEPKIGRWMGWLQYADPGAIDLGGEGFLAGCAMAIVAMLALVLVGLLVAVLFELVIPLLIAALYLLVTAMLRRGLGGAGEAAGRPLAALGVGVWWATIYTAPLALLVLLAHRLA
jgi:hypothetical protein